MVQKKADQADPMDVVAISTGTTPETWDLAQMHPPGPQQPGVDPFADKNLKIEEMDAGALWPRDPEGPKDEKGAVAPLSATMGTTGEVADPQTEAKTVKPGTPDSTVADKDRQKGARRGT